MNQSPAIRLSGLRKTFGSLTAVDGVDLTVRTGEVIALLGPNGAGKSTTIDLALGLARPTAGTAELFGGDPRRAIREGRVGAMLQGGALLPTLTVAESVALVASAHKHPLSVAEALERARCTEIAKQRVSKLSGGQMQRARFAVAVVSNPDLLFLDEPTAAMDVEARRISGSRCGSSPTRAARSCSRRTTSTRPTPTPTGSSCSPAAGSSPTGRRPR
ncbi:ABC transporter ATP-binding protein [Leifsonia shinshuensis]|uniref:ABC-type multidrug transport system ATPase subunit n=1 Tax=Leifsonia shinshuensis TaxID=150026 RepID=A0A853CTD4_9MICO|nr:ABC-type multidrug transport system ATPase subunit [Leifsonia shinshuensis]